MSDIDKFGIGKRLVRMAGEPVDPYMEVNMNEQLKSHTWKYVSSVEGLTGFVLFGASWCGPCQRLKPHITEYIDYYFDVDDPHAIFDVKSIPTIRYYVGGRQHGEIIAPQSVLDVSKFYHDCLNPVIG